MKIAAWAHQILTSRLPPPTPGDFSRDFCRFTINRHLHIVNRLIPFAFRRAS